MSTIQKIAVYDARLQQDEPAYAVQKGALSVSVAPFSAIAATAAQMTFQVLVPSLNVFVDRKLQLSAGLNFTANLFYSGARGPSVKGFNNASGVVLAMTVDQLIANYPASTGSVNPFVVRFSTQPQIGGTNITLPPGTSLYSSKGIPTTTTGTPAALTTLNGPLPPGLIITGNFPGSASTYFINTALPAWAQYTNVNFETPMTFDVPDPVMSVQYHLSSDAGLSNAYQSQAFQPLGYATAVSPKDLAPCMFPLQSSLTNMTATLNDCTTTTNGDTLHEQLLLTNLPENQKQRTTPSNSDVYSWGRDDTNGQNGNFSSYATVDSQGDIPTGAFPITWFSDASQSNPLSAVTTVLASAGSSQNGTLATFPFLPVGSTGNFGLGTPQGVGPQSGVGWYIAAPLPSNVAGASSFPTASIVPFVNNQPVWTTGFPGGDLVGAWNAIGSATDATVNWTYAGDASFVFTGGAGNVQQIKLLKSVPPYCMIGARLYVTSAVTGSFGQTAPTAVGWVANILSGSLGAAGSTYNICAPSTLATNSGYAAIPFGTTFSLSAGYQVTQGPMPVFGQIAVIEPLVISPLIWADSAEFTTVGLYGMTNMQFVLNFGALGTCYAASNSGNLGGTGATPGSAALAAVPWWVDDLTRPTQNTGNIIRSSNIRTVLSDLAFGSSSNQYGPWTNPTIFAEFLTPGPDITLPLVSTVPYVEFPRYVQTLTGSSFAGTQTVRTQTISLTSIPDMVMIYVKPATKGPSQLDQYIPIQNVSVTFDNFSNLCSGFQQFNLYESAVASGLDMDWHQWRGFSQGGLSSSARITSASAAVTTGVTYKQTGVTQLSGGPVILRMGHDITLSPGLAPGCLGNYSFQATVQTSNPYGFYDYLTAVTVTVVAINTGFFETVRGQSAIRKTILNSADVEAATPESGTTKTHLNRMVGRGAYMRGGSHYVGHAKALHKHISKMGGVSAMGHHADAAFGSKRGRVASGIA
jgi:hypothetical protein